MSKGGKGNGDTSTDPDISIELDEPVKGPRGMITHLEMRRPTGKDTLELGLPFETHPQTMRARMDPPVLYQYLVRLAKLPRSTIAELSAGDINIAYLELMPFFYPSDGEADSQAGSED